MMGDVRKKLPKELKDDAMTFRNSITFDLIAVNKAARVENKERALEVTGPPTKKYYQCNKSQRDLDTSSLTDVLGRERSRGD